MAERAPTEVMSMKDGKASIEHQVCFEPLANPCRQLLILVQSRSDIHSYQRETLQQTWNDPCLDLPAF
jgi:hypothetical protein